MAVAALLLMGTVAPVATAADGSSSGDAGPNESSGVEGSAVVDYAVPGQSVVESVRGPGVDAFVTLNHFSTRTVAVAVGSDADDSAPESGEETAESTERRDAAGDTAGGTTPDSSDDPSSSTSTHRLTLAALVTMAAGVLARGI